MCSFPFQKIAALRYRHQLLGPMVQQKTGSKRQRPPAAEGKPSTYHGTVRADKKEMSGDRKRRKLEHRKKKYNLLHDVVAKWEIVRRHDIDAAQKATLTSEIMDQVAGHIAEVAMSHTGSRVVQAVVKGGTSEQHERILEEIMPSVLTLSKSPYGHFLLVRLISKATPKRVAGLVKAVQGQVPALLRHPCGAAVISELYSVASSRLRNLMASEFYGKEFVVFGESAAPASLEALLQDADAKTARNVLQRIALSLTPIVEKGMLDPPLVHRLTAEYLRAAPPATVKETVEALAGPALLRCVHTHSGAAVACCVFAYGTPNNRKKAIKGMKGHVKAMAMDQWGHIVLMAALVHVDDTQLLFKVIVSELKDAVDELLPHKYGRKVLLQLVSPGEQRHKAAHVLELLYPQRLHVPRSEAASEAASEKVETLGVSKKDAGLKRQELLEAGRPSFAQAIADGCVRLLPQLLRGPAATDIVGEIARGGEAGTLGQVAPLGVKAVQDAIFEEVLRPLPASEGEGEAHVLQDFYGSRGVRRLILVCKDLPKDSGSKADCLPFAGQLCSQLWTGVFRGACKDWLPSHGAKVLAAVWHASKGSEKKQIEGSLQGLLKQPVQDWARTCLSTGMKKSRQLTD
eukprot:jgi/Botrbrau1/13740/Bobra.0356s0016.1